MLKSERIEYFKRIENLLKEKNAAILLDYKGLDVESLTLLRKGIKRAGGDFMVIKNTLLRRALQNSNMHPLIPYIQGTIALTVSKNDPISISKIITSFQKTKPCVVKAGFFDGKILNQESIEEFSRFPQREVLIQNLFFVLNSPLYSIGQLLRTPVVNLLSILEGYKNKLANSGG